MAEDEKTCIEHRTYQNGTRKWSYSDGSYRYSNVNPPGSTYYNDDHGHSVYDSGPNRENPYMRFKDTDKNLERVVQKPKQ